MNLQTNLRVHIDHARGHIKATVSFQISTLILTEYYFLNCVTFSREGAMHESHHIFVKVKSVED
jgi:hypothetical protein